MLNFSSDSVLTESPILEIAQTSVLVPGAVESPELRSGVASQRWHYMGPHQPLDHRHFCNVTRLWCIGKPRIAILTLRSSGLRHSHEAIQDDMRWRMASEKLILSVDRPADCGVRVLKMIGYEREGCDLRRGASYNVQVEDEAEHRRGQVGAS